MSTYLISDIHGCYDELRLILKKLSFDSKKDYLWIAGDLVSRGNNSLEVLRYLYSIRNRIKIVLGNHDLNLISVYFGVKENKKENFFDAFLSAKDSLKLINWLRSQSILCIDKQKRIIMVHAGINPAWNINLAKKYALEIKSHLLSDDFRFFLKNIYDDKICNSKKYFNKINHLRHSINSFTRMRYCYPNGQLNFTYKKSPNINSYPLIPWFKMKNSFSRKYSIVFGHWSSLRGVHIDAPFFALDHGCCWGGELMVMRWEDKKYFYQPYLQK
ncbi:diadenosine tetraphosphatase [Buchnera aphidicola (Melanaphis sacchari)]|uniref:bis(5'-nucleosyl)-tetraphosphatase (symmetrical) n=1 Tax=Buchnera aphidicola (Melanaphis sacchari) TaxID=2173854 RepID=A0A2U8DFY5_9GAMM|nr:symmetrical bis(5'-nucleosyl)-tetraphosphatase [Buchnera aphidicola]AWH90623.1 diadenosine tetraphosphatase [Buchnera aphidicola (Melanaphis sacchari)]